MRPLDNPLDNIVPLTNSIPSPAASQMSNLSTPNKFIKIISGRDRGRKAKSLKVNFLYEFRCSCTGNFCICDFSISLIIFLLFFAIRFLLDSLVLEVLGHYLKIRWFGIHLPYQFFSHFLNKYLYLNIYELSERLTVIALPVAGSCGPGA